MRVFIHALGCVELTQQSYRWRTKLENQVSKQFQIEMSVVTLPVVEPGSDQKPISEAFILGTIVGVGEKETFYHIGPGG